MKRLIWTIAACLAWHAAPAHAQGGNVRIVIAFPPGGAVDSVARVLADGLAAELSETVVVENRPGGNGAIAAQAVARAAPDGNTLWLTSAGAAVINPTLYENLSYDMQRDFAPVSLVVNNVEALVVNVSNPARTVADLVAQSKQKPESLAIASTGIGGVPHLTMELFAYSTHASLLHVPYKGGAPAIADLIGNQVSGFFGDIPGVIRYLRAGQLKALGIAAPKRHPLLPDVPTFDEQGIFGVESSNWYALFAPAKTPSVRLERLNTAVRRALAAEPYRMRLVDSGAEPAPGSPSELAALVRTDTAKWSKIIREKQIKGE